MRDDVIICRCQETTYGDVRKAIEEGADTIAGVKKRAGSGMGVCQGKYCEKLVSEIIAAITGIPLEKILPDTKRAPVRPLGADVFLEGAEVHGQ